MKRKATSLLALPVLVLVGLAAAPSGAQQDSTARSCAKIAAAAERLACYDRAFRAGQAEDTQRGRKESPAAPAGSERPAAAAQSERAAAAQNESTAPARREVAARHETPGRRKAPKASAGDSSDFDVTIVRIRQVRQIDETFFITDDGRVWRQTDERQPVFPKPPFQAVISSGIFGGQFLKPVGRRVAVRVSEEQR